ncbi:MAG: O-antigen ligase family protein, partial [Deltaproteobacteria bacterium]|nr:O-antigen ligase family protein [Deltaproteobacteria bacterium]
MVFEGFIRLISASHMLSISATQFFLAGLMLYTFYMFYKKQYVWSDFPYRYFFASLIFFSMLSVFAGVDVKHSLPKLFNWWLYFFFIAMFLWALKRDILPIVTLYTVIGADVASIYCLYQFFSAGVARAQGFFAHPLTFGNTSSMVFCLILACLATRSYRQRKELWFLVVSGALILTALFVSVARGPMLATLATIFIMMPIFYRVKGVVASGIIVVLFLGLVVAIPDARVRYAEMVDNSWTDPDTAIGVRIPLWKASLEIIGDYPLFGIGERNFRQVARQYIGGSLHTMAHAHNAFLHFALTHGLIAFSVLVALMVKLLYDTLPGALRREPVAFMAVSVLIVFLLEGLTENTIGDSEVAMLFYYLMGTLCGTLYRKGLAGPANKRTTSVEDPHDDFEVNAS